MPPLTTERLIATHVGRYNRLRVAAGATIGALWDRYAGLDDAANIDFAERSARVALAAQAATSTATDAYLAATLSLLLDERVTPAGIRSRYPRPADPFEVYQRGGITARAAIAAGRSFDEAFASGRARMVGTAETDVALAQRSATTEILSKHSRVVGYRRVLSGKSCSLCATASTQRYRSETLMPIHAHCVPAGSTVAVPSSSGAHATDLTSIQAMTRRWHVGDLAVLHLASGDEVAVTPNHPVLTNRGWVPAGLISEDDELFSHGAVQREQRRGPHERHHPSLVEDVWRSLSVTGRLVRMPLAPEDLHGEGARGEVDVVWANGYFPSSIHSELVEPSVNQSLMSGHLRRVGLAGEGAAVSLLDRVLTSPDRCVGCGSLSLAFDLAHLRRPELPSATTPPRFDAPGEEFSPQSGPVYAQRGMDLIRRLARQVQADRVVKTSRIGFSGHVYNLHTAEGWYASGCHIVSNCDCGVAPIIGTKDPGQVINEPLLRDLKAAGKRVPDPDYWRSRHIEVDEDGTVRLPGIAVHEHGELGPVLTRASDHFSGPGDIAA